MAKLFCFDELFHVCAVLIFFLSIIGSSIGRVAAKESISNHMRKCCVGGLRHAHTLNSCENSEYEVLMTIPPLWRGLCHSAFGLCCSREVLKQVCTAGRLAALTGSRCDEQRHYHNTTAYADCCRACQLGLAVKASSGENCDDPLFNYFTEIESYRICCAKSDNLGEDGGDVDARVSSLDEDDDSNFDDDDDDNVNEQMVPAMNAATSDGTIILENDDDDICGKVPNLCAHICENTNEAYRCKCRPGFRLDANNVTCSHIRGNSNSKNSDDLESEENNVDGIESAESADLGINAQCSKGYQFDFERSKCIDIDECHTKLHICKLNQYCHNTVGGYRCLNVKSKSCDPGYQFNTEREICEDHNECEDESACDSTQVCVNDIGGYHCDCKLGYTLDPTTNACVDINECSINNHNCLPTQRCDNTVGSYICTRLQSCGTGYTLNFETGNCDDDDECTLNTHNCPTDYECFNTKGSFRCYRRPPPPSTTTSTTTTTTTASTTTSAASTTTTSPSYPLHGAYWNRSHPYSSVYQFPNRYNVSDYVPRLGKPGDQLPCDRGFQRNYLGACVDINECLISSPCGSHQRCINTNGSYRCQNLLQCSAGFRSNPDGTQCIDIDECLTGEHNCVDEQICRNRIGGYICSCPPGHQLSPRMPNGQSRCVDIDECAQEHPSVCPINAYCVNTLGSYYCECKSGYQKSSENNRICLDVDECQEISGLCQQKCVNFWGGYRCTCNTGYELSSDNRTCNDVDECTVHKSYKLCMGFCNNIPGSYECSCPRGYTLAMDKTTCRDIDECSTGEFCTGRNDICTNIRGSYRCTTIQCPYGYVNDPDQKNRCRQASNFCEGDDCYNKPSAYTYNFITLVSNLLIPPEGRIIFSLRGPLWYDDIDFDLKIIKIQAAANIEKAAESHFNMIKGKHEVHVSLKRSLDGPQDIELELSMTVFTNGLPRGKSVAKIFILVSQYTF